MSSAVMAEEVVKGILYYLSSSSSSRTGSNVDGVKKEEVFELFGAFPLHRKRYKNFRFVLRALLLLNIYI